jgi:ankyrin repeat protein
MNDAGIINTMSRINRLGLGALFLALIATPLAAQSFSEGFTFLKAVRERDGTVAERILSNPSSTAVNARDPASGEGALHILVRGRDLTWLSFMLGRRARPDIQSNDGTTPLILSAQLGWVDGAAQLLARGANPNIGNRRGETPLIVAVQRRDLQMVRLLLSQRANPNQTDNLSGNSAIDYARQDPRAAAILRELEQSRTPRPAAPATTVTPRPAPPAATPH